jgi:NADPH2:quinone reductase
MRAMVVPAFGPPEVFEVSQIPDPVPGAGQVLIRVAFVGVNFTDVRNRRGDGLGVPPMIPGIEVAGVVAGVGAGVEGLVEGMPVTALTGGHAYAELVACDASRVLPLPPGLVGDPVSATVMGVLPSALNLLRAAARVLPGETMLIHGASGGVGTALVQAASVLGLGEVHGTVSSPAKAEYAGRYGFASVHLRDDFVSSVRSATAGRGVDVVFDPIGGRVRAESFEVLAPFGRLIHFGNASLEPEVVPAAVDLRARGLGYVGYSGGQHGVIDLQGVRRSWIEGLDLVASGRVTIDVTRVLDLTEAAEAHRLIESRVAVGKIVLAVD